MWAALWWWLCWQEEHQRGRSGTLGHLVTVRSHVSTLLSGFQRDLGQPMIKDTHTIELTQKEIKTLQNEEEANIWAQRFWKVKAVWIICGVDEPCKFLGFASGGVGTIGLGYGQGLCLFNKLFPQLQSDADACGVWTAFRETLYLTFNQTRS